ncbi:MAG: hypothetical protein ABUL48_00905, partial [Pseudorhodoplanes sp.]
MAIASKAAAHSPKRAARLSLQPACHSGKSSARNCLGKNGAGRQSARRQVQPGQPGKSCRFPPPRKGSVNHSAPNVADQFLRRDSLALAALLQLFTLCRSPMPALKRARVGAMAAKKKGAADAEAETDLEDGAEGEGSKPAKKKLPLKLIIIAATAFLVLGGGGTGAYLFFGGKKAAQTAQAAVVKPPVFLDLPDTL